jgi:NTP pyrophosphatase (non-canonical NTP hydrolase)
MNDLQKLTEEIRKFRDKRDWKKFHTPKNLAESLVIEASEILELFQWKSEKEVRKFIKSHSKELSLELADVLNYLLLLADEADIDLFKATHKKIRVNEKKYPVAKSKGSAKKYTEI